MTSESTPPEIVIAAVTAMLNGDRVLAKNLIMQRPLDGTINPPELTIQLMVDAHAATFTAVRLICDLLREIADDAPDGWDDARVWRSLLEGHTIPD